MTVQVPMHVTMSAGNAPPGWTMEVIAAKMPDSRVDIVSFLAVVFAPMT